MSDVKGELSPPLTTSTPVSTPEVESRVSKPAMPPESDSRVLKPALPPKPAVPSKPTPPPPPRQTPETKGYIEITTESLDQALLAVNLGTRVEEVPPPSSPEHQKTETTDEVDRIVNNNSGDSADVKALNNINILQDSITPTGSYDLKRKQEYKVTISDSTPTPVYYFL